MSRLNAPFALIISSDAAGGVEKSSPAMYRSNNQLIREFKGKGASLPNTPHNLSLPRHSRPDRESLTRFPHFAKLPHIDTRLMALHGLPWCATGPWRTAPPATAHTMGTPVRLFGGAPG